MGMACGSGPISGGQQPITYRSWRCLVAYSMLPLACSLGSLGPWPVHLLGIGLLPQASNLCPAFGQCHTRTLWFEATAAWQTAYGTWPRAMACGGVVLSGYPPSVHALWYRPEACGSWPSAVPTASCM